MMSIIMDVLVAIGLFFFMIFGLYLVDTFRRRKK